MNHNKILNLPKSIGKLKSLKELNLNVNKLSSLSVLLRGELRFKEDLDIENKVIYLVQINYK